MRAAAAGLDGDAIILIGIEEVEAGHGSIAQIELAVRGLEVSGFEAAAIEIVEDLGPERFTFSDGYAGAVFERLFG